MPNAVLADVRGFQGRPSSHVKSQHSNDAKPKGLLALQRAAGNRAVVSILAESLSRPTVQRCGAQRHAGCACAEKSPDEERSSVAQRLASIPTRPRDIQVSRQTDAEIIAAGSGQPAWRGSMHALNLILHRHFPAEEQRVYLGCGVNNAAVTAVSADLPTGRSGRVFLTVGPRYGAGTTAGSLPRQVNELRRVLVQVMLWRIATGWLTQADLAFPEVSAALRATDTLHLRRLQSTPGVDKVDQVAKDTITQLLAISTPLGPAATLQADGSATELAGGVVVRLLPDQRAGVKSQTQLSFRPARLVVPPAKTRNGRVVEIGGPLPQPPEVQIQTRYASRGSETAADPATAPSGYGAGASLRLHEGMHGAVYVDYFRNHPYRAFAGVVGMTVAAWRRERRQFIRAYNAWAQGAQTASLCQVDCVGHPTIDAYYAGTRGYVNVCTACATP